MHLWHYEAYFFHKRDREDHSTQNSALIQYQVTLFFTEKECVLGCCYNNLQKPAAETRGHCD